MIHPLRTLPLFCALSSGASMTAQTPPARAPLASLAAAGAFDVKVEPTQDAALPDTRMGRMALVKTYHGDLEATAAGVMLTAGNPASGSAGYVALETVQGTLKGRKGSFLLQHAGTLDGGAQSLSITVVPGSGTGELAGLAGRMTIEIKEGKHTYALAYTLPAKP